MSNLSKSTRLLALSIVGMCAVLAVHTSHIQLATSRAAIDGPADSQRLFLPSATSLRLLALGQEVTLADAYWLRFVQYVGNTDILAAGAPHALDLAELITELDPLYGYAYQSAGVVLSAVGRLDHSDTIFMKGMTHVPGRWQLPFFLAFNHWYERDDLATGAALLRHAASIPGAPRFVNDLIARLAFVGGQDEAARQYFEELLRITTEPSLRAQLEGRLADLQVEADLRWLDEAIARYRLGTGLPPEKLDDLVGRSLTALPVSPTGANYRYSPLQGTVYPPKGPRLGRPVRTASAER